MGLVGFIPSPSSGVIHLGPLTIHLYGLTLLVAILACVWLTTIRWKRAGGDSDLVIRVTVWGVAFGVIGARLYHDLTSWNEVPTPKWKGIFEVWHGGLGVWGGILLGTIAGVIVVRRAGRQRHGVHGRRRARAPARAGDRPDRQLVEPGALRQADVAAVGPEDRPRAPGEPAGASTSGAKAYHPTFLYELIWDLVGVVLLLWLDRRYKFRPPALFALYVVVLLLRPLLRGAAPDRPVASLRRAPAQRLGLGRALRRLDAFFVWWQLLGRGGSGREGTPKVRPRPQPDPARPKMVVPKGRVR